MDFQKITPIEKENKVIIENVKNFNIVHIFDCGQCFRWHRQPDDNYIGVAGGRVLELEEKDGNVILHNCSEEDFNEFWCHYFDLERDYTKIKEVLRQDELLRTAIEFGYGIRILNQDPFELLISFIISANNRIPMIKRAIENISKAYGSELKYNGNTYYSFPTIDQLKNVPIEEFEAMGVGFRAKYIFNAIKDVSEGTYNLDYIKSQSDDECHKELQQFMGVGPKVADCIMLFSMEKTSAFPVDVWVKRAMQHFYVAPDVSLPKIRQFARDKFGELSGFAQQYLFYYARENNIKI